MSASARWFLTCLLAPALLAPDPAFADQVFAFATSSTGTGRLGDWPDAGGATGAAAGDAICQAHAGRGGLPFPQTYIAWLSTSADDAWCRIRGLGGRRDSNCGQPPGPLPAAGPWQRTDGTPFLDEIGAATTIGRVFRALELDESGALLPGARSLWAFTATDPRGVVDSVATPQTCGDWTIGGSTGELITSGVVNRTTNNWSGFLTWATCGASQRLICMRRSAAEPIGPRQFGRTAFLSASSGTGDLASWPLSAGVAGVAGADAVCQSEAGAAGLAFPGSFKAWLSDDSTSAAARIQWDGTWARRDGMAIASNLADLLDGGPATSINILAAGNAYLGGFAVFTGTWPDGSGTADNCRNWTSAATVDGFRYGSSNAVQDQWTFSQLPTSPPLPCNLAARLYCFADHDQLFADDNEFPAF